MHIYNLPHYSGKIKWRGGRRQRPPLTVEQRQHADAAWRYCQPWLVKLQARNPRADLVAGLLAERITMLIPLWDGAILSIEEWAAEQYHFALKTLVRCDDAETVTRKPRLRTVSLVPRMDGLPAPERRGEWEADDLRDHLCKPLSDRNREILIRYAKGEQLARIGDHVGLSESRVSQLLTRDILPLIRERYQQISA